MLRSLFQACQVPLRVVTEEDTTALKETWLVALAFTEYMARTVALSFGAQTPFQKELVRLKVACQLQYKHWEKRIATKDYYEALHRKRITYQQCLLLLDGLAEVDTERDLTYSAAYEEVQLPGSSEEAEAFLAVEIEEEYEAKAAADAAKLPLEFLRDLGSSVESCLQFTIGDRVIVDVPEDAQVDESLTDIAVDETTCPSTED